MIFRTKADEQAMDTGLQRTIARGDLQAGDGSMHTLRKMKR